MVFDGTRDKGTRLERDIAAVADNLCTDLDQLLFEGCHRPILDELGHRQRAGNCRDCGPALESGDGRRWQQTSDMTALKPRLRQAFVY
jgi:hypothetical protein